MQRTIRVPNKWLVMIGLLWSIVFAALISATGALVDEPRIEGLTPEEALELARTLPPHLDWKLLYPDEALEQNSSYAYRSGIRCRIVAHFTIHMLLLPNMLARRSVSWTLCGQQRLHLTLPIMLLWSWPLFTHFKVIRNGR